MTARREFLKLGLAASVQAAGVAVAQPVSPAGASPSSRELEEATVSELGARMAKGEVTSALLTRAYLDRIAAVDRGPAGLRSISVRLL